MFSRGTGTRWATIPRYRLVGVALGESQNLLLGVSSDAGSVPRWLQGPWLATVHRQGCGQCRRGTIPAYRRLWQNAARLYAA